MLDQTWRCINLWKLLLRSTDNRAVMIEDHCPRTGSALIQGKHILCHDCLLSSSKYIRLYKTTTYRIGTGSGACAGNKNKTRYIIYTGTAACAGTNTFRRKTAIARVQAD